MKFSTVLPTLLCALPSQVFAAAKPNVIVFLVDDMGWMNCGVSGSKYYETPNLDRSGSVGAGKVEWLPKGAADPTIVKSVPFNVATGDWQELSTNVPEAGPLGTMRVYLPASQQAVEVDWIEVAPAKGKAQRWNFDAQP